MQIYTKKKMGHYLDWKNISSHFLKKSTAYTLQKPNFTYILVVCNVSIPPPRHQTIIHRPSVVNHVVSHVITSHGHDNQSKSFLISIKELTDK